MASISVLAYLFHQVQRIIIGQTTPVRVACYRVLISSDTDDIDLILYFHPDLEMQSNAIYDVVL